MGSHQRAAFGTSEWLTPPEMIASLGEFDLDPCAPVERPWNMAKAHYTIVENGLLKPWFGRVWCNPPYGLESRQWIARLAHHGNGIALIFARTDTDMFAELIWGKANALLFIRGRLFFHYVDGKKASANAGAPSVLVAYGHQNAIAPQDSGISGTFVHGWAR